MPRSIAIRILSFLAISAMLPAVASAQLDEALQISGLQLPSGARSEAMDGSLIAVPGGIPALEYNPAAIAGLRTRDVTFSVFNRDHSSDALFFNSTSNASLANTSISSVGIAAPFPTVQGHFAVGISYDRVLDYTRTYSFSAVNPNSSYFNTVGFLSTNGAVAYKGDATSLGNKQYLMDNSIAYHLGLTYDVPDSGAYMLTTPFAGGLQQSGTVTEEGSLNAVRIGAGIDIAEGISAGATLNLYFGSRDYTRNYSETDVNGIFAHDTGTDVPAHFQSAEIVDNLHQDQSGGGLKLGLLIDKLDLIRFGLTIETPTIMHVDETSWQTGTATYLLNPPHYDQFTNDNGATSSEFIYDIITPVRFGAGASLHLAGLTAAASVSYADMSQIHFTNSDADLTVLNDAARNDLRGVLAWQLGAEYHIPLIGLSVRAGYGDEPSPYKNDPSTFDTKTLSGGLGLSLGKSLLLEAAIRHSTYHTSHAIYNDVTTSGTVVGANITDDAVKRDDVTLTFHYRY